MALLTSNPHGVTAYIDADLRDPASILDDPTLTATLDLSRPVALMLVAVMHFVPDQNQPYELVHRLADTLPAGSNLVLSHATGDVNEGGPSSARSSASAPATRSPGSSTATNWSRPESRPSRTGSRPRTGHRAPPRRTSACGPAWPDCTPDPPPTDLPCPAPARRGAGECRPPQRGVVPDGRSVVAVRSRARKVP